MSVDPRKLQVGDKVKFGGVIIKEIAFRGVESIWFSSGGPLNKNDPLWEIAELEKPSFPRALHAGYLTASNVYRLIWAAEFSVPSVLLTLLKQDVAMLEAAGVKEGDE